MTSVGLAVSSLKEEAEHAKSKLEEAGATVELTGSDHPTEIAKDKLEQTEATAERISVEVQLTMERQLLTVLSGLSLLLVSCGNSSASDLQKCDDLAVEIVANGVVANDYSYMSQDALLNFEEADKVFEYAAKGERALKRAQEARDESIDLGCKDGERIDSSKYRSAVEQRVKQLKAEPIKVAEASPDPNIVTTVPSQGWVKLNDPGSKWADADPNCRTDVTQEDVLSIEVSITNVLDTSVILRVKYEVIMNGGPMVGFLPLDMGRVEPGELGRAVFDYETGWAKTDTAEWFTCSLTEISLE